MLNYEGVTDDLGTLNEFAEVIFKQPTTTNAKRRSAAARRTLNFEKQELTAWLTKMQAETNMRFAPWSTLVMRQRKGQVKIVHS